MTQHFENGRQKALEAIMNKAAAVGVKFGNVERTYVDAGLTGRTIKTIGKFKILQGTGKYQGKYIAKDTTNKNFEVYSTQAEAEEYAQPGNN